MIKHERLVCEYNIYDDTYVTVIKYDDNISENIVGVNLIKQFDNQMIYTHDFTYIKKIVDTAYAYGIGYKFMLIEDYEDKVKKNDK